ncbi:MAG: acyl-CoA dehydrogenase family protein, partial [Nitrospinota bacterium]
RIDLPAFADALSSPCEVAVAATLRTHASGLTNGWLAVGVDASALLVYRAAWTKDILGTRVSREAAMAKLYATESAQQVIDQAVQLFGGLGVVSGVPVERLYREIRALRIYEGTSEVMKLVIASNVLGKT